MSPRKGGLLAGQLPQETQGPLAEAGAGGTPRQPGPSSKGTGSESELLLESDVRAPCSPGSHLPRSGSFSPWPRP